MRPFQSFDEFYSEYMKYHQHVWNRRIHLLGWCLGIGIILWSVSNHYYVFSLAAPMVGLLAIWIGHYYIEPTTAIEFKYPLLTARANIRMFISMLFGELPL
jgi:hypothetical protein